MLASFWMIFGTYRRGNHCTAVLTRALSLFGFQQRSLRGNVLVGVGGGPTQESTPPGEKINMGKPPCSGCWWRFALFLKKKEIILGVTNLGRGWISMSVTQPLCSKVFKFWGEAPRKITGAGAGGLLWLGPEKLLPGWPWVIDTEPQTCGSGNVWKMICLLAIEVSFEKRKWEILSRTVLCQMLKLMLFAFLAVKKKPTTSPNHVLSGQWWWPRWPRYYQVLPTNHWDLDTYIYIYYIYG